MGKAVGYVVTTTASGIWGDLKQDCDTRLSKWRLTHLAPPGMGKSSLGVYLVAKALKENWTVLYIPNGDEVDPDYPHRIVRV